AGEPAISHATQQAFRGDGKEHDRLLLSLRPRELHPHIPRFSVPLAPFASRLTRPLTLSAIAMSSAPPAKSYNRNDVSPFNDTASSPAPSMSQEAAKTARRGLWAD